MKKIMKMKKIFLSVLLLTFCFCNSILLAAENSYLDEALKSETQFNSTSYSKPINVLPIIARVVFSLILVIILMIVLAYLVKKFVPYSNIKRKDTFIRVVDMTYLSPKKIIYIIEVAGEILVVGSDANSLNLLTKIEDAEIKKNILANLKPAAKGNYFSGILGKIMKEENSKEMPANKNIARINEQIQKLKGLKSDS